jgi:hypothetical protein
MAKHIQPTLRKNIRNLNEFYIFILKKYFTAGLSLENDHEEFIKLGLNIFNQESQKTQILGYLKEINIDTSTYEDFIKSKENINKQKKQELNKENESQPANF